MPRIIVIGFLALWLVAGCGNDAPNGNLMGGAGGDGGGSGTGGVG